MFYFLCHNNFYRKWLFFWKYCWSWSRSYWIKEIGSDSRLQLPAPRFSPLFQWVSYETLLTLTLSFLYQSDSENGSVTNGSGSAAAAGVNRVSCIQTHVKASSLPPLNGHPPVRDVAGQVPPNWAVKSSPQPSGSGSGGGQAVVKQAESKSVRSFLPNNASAEATANWLHNNRYGMSVTFRESRLIKADR